MPLPSVLVGVAPCSLLLSTWMLVSGPHFLWLAQPKIRTSDVGSGASAPVVCAPVISLFCTITVLTGLREKLFCTSTPAHNVMLGLTAIFRLFTLTPLTPSIVTSPALSPVQSFVRVALPVP